MRTKHVAMLIPALALGVLAISAEAQHRATRLGNPATRFGKPMRQADDVRVLVRGEKTKADVAAILSEVAWKGKIEDLDRAAASAQISDVRVPSGTRLPFMASRLNGRPHALVDVLWAGREPIEALAFEFSSNCERYRLVTPRACGNFWIEDLGRDGADPKCAPPSQPVVSVSGAGEACVMQPVEYAVKVTSPPSDGKVTVSVNGKEAKSGQLTDGAYKYTFAGGPTPGTYEIRAVSGGVSSTSTVRVKPCPPTCSIVASPLPVRAGQSFTVDLSGSRVAAGVQGGIRSARVEVVDSKGAVVSAFELGAPGMRRSDVVLRKDGILRAAVTDEAGQTSTNACEVQAGVQDRRLPFFVGAYAGKERLFQEEPFYPNGRCAEIIGAELGIQPKIGENSELEAAFGVKVNLRDSENTSVFGDVAVNRILGNAFLGIGLSAWDLTESDTRSIALLLQGGFDLTRDGKWQLAAQARTPFSEMGDIDNNYMVWGGLRFRPFSVK